jgi:hypothetical protein
LSRALSRRRGETEGGTALRWVSIALVAAFGFGAAFVAFGGLGASTKVASSALSLGTNAIGPFIPCGIKSCLTLTVSGSTSTYTVGTGPGSTPEAVVTNVQHNDMVEVLISYRTVLANGQPSSSTPVPVCQGQVVSQNPTLFSCPVPVQPQSVIYLQASDLTTGTTSNVVTLYT